jgi:glycosyltransferase involved in cell wall biosynthesis
MNSIQYGNAGGGSSPQTAESGRISGSDSKRPLRVLHVLHSISPLCGGPVENLWFLLKAARMAGIETAVATTDHHGPDRFAAVPLDRFVEVNGFQVRYFPRQLTFYTVSIPMLRWLWVNVRAYDLVHVHALFSFAPIAAAYCARRRGIPYVLSPHGVLNVWGRENRRPLLKRTSIRYVEAPLIRDAARVQFTSRRELEEFRQLAIPTATEVIPLAVSVPGDTGERDFAPSPELLALQGRPAVLFLARIHPIKNLDMLLQAFAGVVKRHPTAVLLVAGDGEATLVAGLRQLAFNLGIERHIHWTGFADKALKRWLLERASVFVLPSWSENFGIAAAEAMAAGIPVIVTRGAGIADIVAANRCGLVAECSVEALQQAIESLFNDAGARTRMGGAGKQAVREELSLETYADRVQRMYRAAARPGPAA